jgi:hypothetical protein
MDPASTLPPFEQVVTGLHLGADVETRTFDLTIGRRYESPRDGDAAGRLPELAVALGREADVVAPSDATDLQVAELIGRGGMGEVWLARQRSLGRDVVMLGSFGEVYLVDWGLAVETGRGRGPRPEVDRPSSPTRLCATYSTPQPGF